MLVKDLLKVLENLNDLNPDAPIVVDINNYNNTGKARILSVSYNNKECKLITCDTKTYDNLKVLYEEKDFNETKKGH